MVWKRKSTIIQSLRYFIYNRNTSDRPHHTYLYYRPIINCIHSVHTKKYSNNHYDSMIIQRNHGTSSIATTNNCNNFISIMNDFKEDDNLPPLKKQKRPSSPPSHLQENHIRMSKTLHKFQLYNWKPNVNLSDDVNYMDLVMLITRNSLLKQGSMGCIIVKHKENNEENGDRIIDKLNKEKEDQNGSNELKLFHQLESSILAASTNESFYNSNSSDIHAEMIALSECNKNGNISSTANATIYITMPPCKKCFSVLVKSGITRIVTRIPCVEVLVKIAEREGVALFDLSDTDAMFSKTQNDRIEEFITKYKKEMNVD